MQPCLSNSTILEDLGLIHFLGHHRRLAPPAERLRRFLPVHWAISSYLLPLFSLLQVYPHFRSSYASSSLPKFILFSYLSRLYYVLLLSIFLSTGLWEPPLILLLRLPPHPIFTLLSSSSWSFFTPVAQAFILARQCQLGSGGCLELHSISQVQLEALQVVRVEKTHLFHHSAG